MLVVLDFGSALNKALIYREGEFSFYKFNTSYSAQVFSARNILESLKKLERLSSQKIIGEKNKPLADVYLVSALPLPSQLSDLEIIKSSFSTEQALAALATPILEVGSQFIFFNGRTGVATFESQELLTWLAFKMNLSDVNDYLENQKLYSTLLPIFPRDLGIEMAAAREKIRTLLRNQSDGLNLEQITLSGGIFCACPFADQSLQIFLDSFENLPTKTDVFLDRQNVLSCLGVLKSVAEKVYDAVPNQLLPTFLGSVLRLSGSVELRLSVGLPSELTTQIGEESLFVFPLAEGDVAQAITASLASSESRRASLASSEPVSPSSRRGGSRRARLGEPGGPHRESSSKQIWSVRGGLLGLVVDTRRYPLSFPADSARRLEIIKTWQKQLGGPGRAFAT